MCFKINSCCCWFGLEVGVQIIGLLAMLSSAAEMLYFVVSALLMPLPQLRLISVYIVLGVLIACEFFAASIFTYATFKKHASFMMPWIGVACLKGTVLFILFLVDLAMLAQGVATPSAIALNIAYIVHALVLLYFAIVSNSRRKEIQQEDQSIYTSRLMRTDSTTHVYI